MGEADVVQRRRILLDLLHNFSGKNVTLEAFGSCCNGFGLTASDLDVMLAVKLAIVNI